MLTLASRPHPLLADGFQFLTNVFSEEELADEETVLTLRDSALGTEGYMAPEQAQGGEIEHRMDDLVGWLGARPYFYADEPSMADLAVYAMLKNIRGGTFGPADRLLDRRPQLLSFMRRVEKATGATTPPA